MSGVTPTRDRRRRAGVDHDQWHATLAVDPADPYLFDHPLDHVPGMALVCGLFGLLRSAAADGAPGLRPDGRRTRVTLRFPGFSELDRPVELAVDVPTASGADPVEVTLRASQGETTVSAGSYALSPDAPRARPAAGRRVTADTGPADPALVHRRRPENVLISAATPDGDSLTAAIRQPPAGHPLADPAARLELIVDAGRQFATMLHHLARQARPGDTFVLLDLTADLPGDLTGDLGLRWTPTPPRRGPQRTTLELLTDGAPTGRLEFRYHVASPAVYQRLRQPSGPAVEQGGAPDAGRGLVGRPA
ncbi:AfsA-related hotdog domain-containing protein [Micromonospora sp. WMMD882]|uniref:AfsA-related hotdog domain-containing protein n=1 Tax=Micromonospora sp. WMMD882 TaxID=3015151 RepID=UPI00248C60D8|nr:AfsA-related hotdog domain-containing protein [Micromonospora sp. WMMD882]WBB80678.1 AfsA-related hotdog domain-containing protein [Micromonospora sp. WMMD882]